MDDEIIGGNSIDCRKVTFPEDKKICENKIHFMFPTKDLNEYSVVFKGKIKQFENPSFNTFVIVILVILLILIIICLGSFFIRRNNLKKTETQPLV